MSIPLGYVRVPAKSVGIGFRQKIKDDLTIVAASTSSFDTRSVVHKLWHETSEYIGVPRGYYLNSLKHRGVDGIAEFTKGEAFTNCDRGFDLRDGQEEIISKAVSICTEHGYGGCILESSVGSGKSIMTLEIARRLGCKTMIVVPTSVLMVQWKNEINKFYPKWRVGQIQGSTLEVRGYDVCLAMINSISMKDDYPEWLFKEFGTIITDEVHRVGSEEFSKGAIRFAAKYLIGASGTVQRKDKCEKVFIHNMGQVLPFLNALKTMEPHVYFIDTKFAWYSKRNTELDRQRVNYLSDLVLDTNRNLIIVRQAGRAAKAGRNVLVLSERVNHVKELVDKIRVELAGTGLTVGELIGTTPEEDRVESQKANVIVATIQLAGTGMNIPRLDTLIFGCPSQNVDQAIGRVTRLHPGKLQPIVLDLVDSQSETGMTFAKSRMKKYMLKKYRMFNLSVFPREFLWKHQQQLKPCLPPPKESSVSKS